MEDFAYYYSDVLNEVVLIGFFRKGRKNKNERKRKKMKERKNKKNKVLLHATPP